VYNGSTDVYLSNNYASIGGASKYITTAAATLYQQGAGTHAWYTAASGTAGDAISFSQAMTLDASGNLGIGTTSPSTRLHVVSSGNPTITLAGSDGAYSSIFSMVAAGGGSSVINANGGQNTLLLQTNSTTRAVLDSSGNLLVGTTTVGAKLTVEQTGASANGASIINQTFNYQTLGLQNAATSGDNIFIAFGTEAAFTTRGSITYNRAGGLTAYNVTSDYRAKDILGPVVGSGALIDSVPVYMGKMKDATQERPMFIAHEVPAYAHTGVKDAVDADGNPVYQQMDASALIPVMWAEIQSLRARLAAANI
jgi:hypothetical protein